MRRDHGCVTVQQVRQPMRPISVQCDGALVHLQLQGECTEQCPRCPRRMAVIGEVEMRG